MCEHYAPRIPKRCEIDETEEVRDKRAANFCDYFRPAPGRYRADLAAAQDRAASELADLFGESGKSDGEEPDPPSDDSLRKAEDLFR